jgi:hypothetical protein
LAIGQNYQKNNCLLKKKKNIASHGFWGQWFFFCGKFVIMSQGDLATFGYGPAMKVEIY